MVLIQTGKLRLLSAPSIPGGVTPEPLVLVPTRSAMGSGHWRLRFCVTFGPDGLFSRDRTSGRKKRRAAVNQRPAGSKRMSSGSRDGRSVDLVSQFDTEGALHFIGPEKKSGPGGDRGRQETRERLV